MSLTNFIDPHRSRCCSRYPGTQGTQTEDHCWLLAIIIDVTWSMEIKLAQVNNLQALFFWTVVQLTNKCLRWANEINSERYYNWHQINWLQVAPTDCNLNCKSVLGKQLVGPCCLVSIDNWPISNLFHLICCFEVALETTTTKRNLKWIQMSRHTKSTATIPTHRRTHTYPRTA